MKPLHVLIISPALAGANKGNWQTAWRWSRMLRPQYRTTIASQWRGEGADVMRALHARKSAPAALAHGPTRGHIQRAHVLVHPSKMEGGAQVILEAVQSGTPVLASRINGNVGMLGPDYAGYFAVCDDAALAQLLRRCRDDAHFLPLLRQQCEARAPLFEPQRERALLRQLVATLAP